MENDSDPTSILNDLRQARDEWIDEIPKQTVHSIDGKYKARAGWFIGIAADLYNGLDEGLFPDPSVQQAIRTFIDWYKNDYAQRRQTLPEDIQKTNRIISIALGEVQVHTSNKLNK